MTHGLNPVLASMTARRAYWQAHGLTGNRADAERVLELSPTDRLDSLGVEVLGICTERPPPVVLRCWAYAPNDRHRCGEFGSILSSSGDSRALPGGSHGHRTTEPA